MAAREGVDPSSWIRRQWFELHGGALPSAAVRAPRRHAPHGGDGLCSFKRRARIRWREGAGSFPTALHGSVPPRRNAPLLHRRCGGGRWRPRQHVPGAMVASRRRAPPCVVFSFFLSVYRASQHRRTAEGVGRRLPGMLDAVWKGPPAAVCCFFLPCAAHSARQRFLTVRLEEGAWQTDFTVQKTVVCPLPCASIENTRQSLCRVFAGLCRSPETHGKARVSVVMLSFGIQAFMLRHCGGAPLFSRASAEQQTVIMIWENDCSVESF
jgi:hypothetical protein